MKNHIHVSEKSCFGCRACENSCPTNVISMKADAKGFLYPVIDEDKCISCGMCVNACPVVNGKVDETDNAEQTIYALMATDQLLRMQSTSGGAFTLLALQVIADGGTVYGAVLDRNLYVKHSRADSPEQLGEMRGSKYVQSDTEDTYKQVAGDLKNGKPVMFTGTPCQVDGLKQFTRANKIPDDLLLTVDLLCHGVPSPQIWKDYTSYLSEKYHSKLIDFKFRTKIAGWENSIECAIFENGKKVINTPEIRTYLTMFYKNTSLRPMCYECWYHSYTRCSDITIGDFWGVDRSKSEINDNRGLSLVLVNTTKGKKWLSKVSSSGKLISISREMCSQSALERNAVLPKNTEQFWKDYSDKGFTYVAEKYGKRGTGSLIKVKLITVLYKVHLLKFFKKVIGR